MDIICIAIIVIIIFYSSIYNYWFQLLSVFSLCFLLLLNELKSCLKPY